MRDAVIYADHAASTPCLVSVITAVEQALRSDFGNPSSSSHRAGRHAAAMREAARSDLATLLGVHDDELIVTSGATEACNQLIFGVAEQLMAQRPRLLASAIEHPAVLGPLRACAHAGASVETIAVDETGRLDIEQLRACCDKRCALVCVMLANNETGVIQDLPAVCTIAHAAGALVFCDCTQALGKIPLDLHALGVDAAACSGHKCAAPKGIGMLYLRRGLHLPPLLHGGGQERGLRAGTENLPGLVGFAAAARWLIAHGSQHQAQLAAASRQLEDGLRAAWPALRIFSAEAPRVPGISMFAHPQMRPGWLRHITRIACSAGSSCHSGQPAPTLRAMGISDQLAGNALRLSFGHGSGPQEVDRCLQHVIDTGQRLLPT